MVSIAYENRAAKARRDEKKTYKRRNKCLDQESKQPSEKQICNRMVLSSHTLDVRDDVCTTTVSHRLHKITILIMYRQWQRKAEKKEIPSSITPRHIWPNVIERANETNSPEVSKI